MYTEKANYEISLKGHLDQRWADRFEGMVIKTGLDPQGLPITVLSGLAVDQAALHGILAKIRDIGIPVISINRIGSE